MRKFPGMIVMVFVASLIIGTSNPCSVNGCETPGGNPWDILLDPGPFPGISLTGPLSIYYAIDSTKTCMGESSYLTTMYYTLRLTKNGQIYTFQGTANSICLVDISTQGSLIRTFLESFVVPGIFQEGFKSWKFKSIEKAQYHFQDDSMSFVADIEVVVKKK